MLPPRVLVPLVLSAVLCGAELPRDYGGAWVAGGHDKNGYAILSVGHFEGATPLPDLPIYRSGNTLTLVGSVLYNCVYYSCYTINTSSSDPQWLETVSLPVDMYGHTAVAVGSHIWLMKDNSIYDLDTATNEILTYQTPFEISTCHCAVSNDGHSFVLGAGHYNEIWLNSVSYSPAQWEHVGNLSVARLYFGCLWFENYILSTGGFPRVASTELFDLDTGKSQVTGDLVTGRDGHQMFVFDRKPAVFAGRESEYQRFGTIETYDAETGTWTNGGLVKYRDDFGLAQFVH